MKQHVSIVAYLYIAFGILYILAAFATAAILIGTGVFVRSGEGGAEAFGILLLVAVVVGLLLLVLGLPGIIGGLGLLKYRSWARILVLVLGALNLVNIPFGTALGVYTFWTLLNDEAEALFAAGGTA